MFLSLICTLSVILQIGIPVNSEDIDLNPLSSNYYGVNENSDNFDSGIVQVDRISKRVIEKICQNSDALIYVKQDDVIVNCESFFNEENAEDKTRVEREAVDEVEGSGHEEIPPVVETTTEKKTTINVSTEKKMEEKSDTEDKATTKVDLPSIEEKEEQPVKLDKNEQTEAPLENENQTEETVKNEEQTEETIKHEEQTEETVKHEEQTEETVKNEAPTEESVKKEQPEEPVHTNSDDMKKEWQNRSEKNDPKKDAEVIKGRQMIDAPRKQETKEESTKTDDETIETKASTSGAKKAGSKDTTILLFLLGAVVVVGVAAFGYHIIKKRRQQSADLERVERSPVKTSLQNLAKLDEPEKKPLIGDKKEVEMVDMKKEPAEEKIENGTVEPVVKS